MIRGTRKHKAVGWSYINSLPHTPTALLQPASHSCFTDHIFSFNESVVQTEQVKSCVRQINVS